MRREPNARFARRLTVAALMLACACASPTAADSVASIVIEPESLVMQTSESCDLHANLFNASGGAVTGVRVAWTTSAPGIVSITKGGKALALGTGSTTVTATVNGRTSTLAVTVIPRIFNSVLQPAARTVAIGTPDQMSLVLYDISENLVSVAVPTAWGVDDPSKATVSSTGLLMPLAVGTVLVTARWATGGSLYVNNTITAVFIVTPGP